MTWDDRDRILAASLLAKFYMLDIKHYSGVGCPKIHLRLYSTIMRAHGLDDAQLVVFFPMSMGQLRDGLHQSSLRDLAHRRMWPMSF